MKSYKKILFIPVSAVALCVALCFSSSLFASPGDSNDVVFVRIVEPNTVTARVTWLKAEIVIQKGGNQTVVELALANLEKEFNAVLEKNSVTISKTLQDLYNQGYRISGVSNNGHYITDYILVK